MAADRNPEVNLETGNHPNSGEEGERVEVKGVSEREMGDMERVIYLQVELYADEENDSTENKRKKRMARAALTMWKEKSDTIQSRILQAKSEMRSIMNEVYQLVSLYSVFEGVVWTAVATSSRLECRHLWSPVGFSLFVYSMVVVVAFTKFREIRELERMQVVHKEANVETMRRVLILKNLGYAAFDFDRDCRVREPYTLKAPFWRNALGFIVPLTIFTVGLVVSFSHILCWS